METIFLRMQGCNKSKVYEIMIMIFFTRKETSQGQQIFYKKKRPHMHCLKKKLTGEMIRHGFKSVMWVCQRIKIRKNTLRWHKHIQMIDEDRLLKKVFKSETECK